MTISERTVGPSKLHQKTGNPNDQTLLPSAAKYLGSFTAAPSCGLFFLQELTFPKEESITENQGRSELMDM